MMQSFEELLEQSLTSPNRKHRRQAFLKLISTEHWRLALTPQVIAQQGYALREDFFPDVTTYLEAAPAIAANEEQIQLLLENVGCRFSEELLSTVAHIMGKDLVDHLLPHLRTAQGERSVILLNLLYEADPRWVDLPTAKRVIRQHLRTPSRSRYQLLNWLAAAGNLEDFLDEVREHPPLFTEEWNALGKSGIRDTSLIYRALAALGSGPEPLAYLLQLDPVPEGVTLRLMAAARPDWLIQGLEVAISAGIHHRLLLSLAELGIRLGGKAMATAVAWLNSAQWNIQVLKNLDEVIIRNEGRTRVNDLLWVQRRSSSAATAFEQGRKGLVPDMFDAAALVRQVRGEKIMDLVREIIQTPLPTMMETVLHPLCGVSLDAAHEIITLCKSNDPEVAKYAQHARGWPDVIWPETPALPEE